jgi:hypothetical protein
MMADIRKGATFLGKFFKLSEIRYLIASAAPAISTCFFQPDVVLIPSTSKRNKKPKGVHFNTSSADVLKKGWFNKKYLCMNLSIAVAIIHVDY